MKFKVGQRVRVAQVNRFGCAHPAIGSVGTILGPDHMGLYEYAVRHDSEGDNHHYHDGFELSPLTDPGFESFMERIQKPLTKPEWEAA